MSFGIGWKVWQLGQQKNRRPCPRCSLKYDKTLNQCPHCGDLDSNGLTELRLQIEQNQHANTTLGKLFVFIAIMIVIALVIINYRQ